MTPKQVAGLMAPNRKLSDLPGGGDEFYAEAAVAGMTWLKFLFPDHDVATVKAAHDRGYKVILRAPGEGLPTVNDVGHMIYQYTGVVDVIELGNEPNGVSPHCWQIGQVLESLRWLATRRGIKLCSPGWNASAEPPDPSGGGMPLALWNAYMACDYIGVHCYGSYNFDGQLQRVARWQTAFYGKSILITEYGIPARDLIGVPANPARYDQSMSIKASRYATFVEQAAAMGVEAACAFISNQSTEEWGRFTAAGTFDPMGDKSYWLTTDAWKQFAATLNPQ